MAKKRSSNWSTDELTALVDGIEEHRCQIIGAFSARVTLRSKNDAWGSVVSKIDAVNISGSLRTTQQVEHKWYNIKSTAKRRVALYRKESQKTGGGINTTPMPSEFDRRVIFIIGEESVDGVSGAKDVSWLSTPLVPIPAIREAQHAASPSPSLLIAQTSHHLDTQTESTQEGQSPYDNNPLLYQPAPFTALFSHSVPIADQLPVKSPISHQPQAGYDMQNHRPSSNPWSTAQPERGDEPSVCHISCAKSGIISFRRNHENDPLPNSKSLSSLASRLHVGRPKAPLWKFIVPDSIDRLRTPWMKTGTPEIDHGMFCCSLLNHNMDGLQSEMVYSPWFTHDDDDPIYIPKGKFLQIINIRKDHWIAISNEFSRDPNTVVIYDSAYRPYEQEQFEQISRLLRPGNRMNVIFSPVQQQSPGSNLCGHYAISYSKAICQGIEPERVVIDEGTLRNDVAVWLEACYYGKTIDQDFEQRMESPSLPLGKEIIGLCCICKLPYEEQCCFCYKHSHRQCQLFYNVGCLRQVRCKLCHV